MANSIEIIADSARGVFIPQHAAECLAPGWTISAADRETLAAGPGNENYWDTWNTVEQTAEYTDPAGNVWRLHQDGDLFAYCEALMTDDEYAGLFGEVHGLPAAFIMR